jgi:hypothetical protein
LILQEYTITTNKYVKIYNNLGSLISEIIAFIRENNQTFPQVEFKYNEVVSSDIHVHSIHSHTLTLSHSHSLSHLLFNTNPSLNYLFIYLFVHFLFLFIFVFFLGSSLHGSGS